MNTLFFFGTLLLGLVSLLPLSKRKYWWIRCWDFPRLQIFILTLVWFLFGCSLWVLHYQPPTLLFAVLIAIAVYQMKWIYPYSQFHAPEVLNAETSNNDCASIKLLISNVLRPNKDAEKLKALIIQYSPDIFATLETDDWWEAKLDELPGYPHKLSRPLDNLYGMHVYSKFKFIDEQILDIVEEEVPSMHMRIVLPEGEKITLHVLHPKPPAPQENHESIQRDIELLIMAKKLENSTDNIIVTGDLNDVAWSATTRLFRQISGLLDVRVGRGFYNTFHADHWFLRWPLDHIFTSSHFRVKKIMRLPHIGSDHFPVFAELALTKAVALDTHPNPDEADAELIEETLNSPAAENVSTQL